MTSSGSRQRSRKNMVTVSTWAAISVEECSMPSGFFYSSTMVVSIAKGLPAVKFPVATSSYCNGSRRRSGLCLLL